MVRFTNIKKSKGTTILGVVLIVSGVLSVFLKESSWTEASIIIGTGIWLLFEDDPKLKYDGKEQSS